MKLFIREFFDPHNNLKSFLGALLMGAFLVYENRGNPVEMYTIALCGQLIYSFFLGNFWMSSYQTLKKKMPYHWVLRGIISSLLVAMVAGAVTAGVQTVLMNPEAIATAWWAFRLSLIAFLSNEAWQHWHRA